MSRKRTPRRVIQPMPPRGLRLPISASRRTNIAIVLHENLDAIASGQAHEQILWDVAECAFTWARVAEVLGTGMEEMAAQLELATRLVERYGATGRIAFEGCEYDAARLGVQAMQDLAELVDQPTAAAATAYSAGWLRDIKRAHQVRVATTNTGTAARPLSGRTHGEP